MSAILTFDVGTTAIKAVLVFNKSGKTVSAKADVSVFQSHPGWAEQDADELWKKLCEVSRECVEKSGINPQEIIGMVIAAPWKHIIPLDEQCQPLRSSIIWMDARAKEQAARLNQTLGKNIENAQGYWARLMWLKENEPEIWNKAASISGLNTFFKCKATGEFVTECSDDHIHSPIPQKQEEFTNILRAGNITDDDLKKFPSSKACTDCIGTVSEKAAAELGIEPGVPVFNGFGDLPAVYFGAGCLNAGTAHIYLGTSSWFGELISSNEYNYSRSFFMADDEHQGACFGLTTAGRAYDWAIHRFYPNEAAQSGDRIYDLIEKEITSVPAGCEDLIVTHWLNGEQPPLSKNGKGVFFNVTEQHDRRHFVRAMLESICYSHRRSLDTYIEYHGKKPNQLNVVGGGALSEVWMQMMADVLQMPIIIPNNPRLVGTLGARRCAQIGLGIESDFCIDTNALTGRIYQPNSSKSKVYDRMYKIYLELHPALKPLYDEINGIY